MPGTKILIVDDDVIWHKLIDRLLDGAGYDIRTAGSRADGLQMVEIHRPDCILLDFHLGDGNAVSICSELRQHGAVMPVIVMSSDPEAETPAYAECHAAYFIFKGSHFMTDLRNIVEKVLGKPDAPASYDDIRSGTQEVQPGAFRENRT